MNNLNLDSPENDELASYLAGAAIAPRDVGYDRAKPGKNGFKR